MRSYQLRWFDADGGYGRVGKDEFQNPEVVKDVESFGVLPWSPLADYGYDPEEASFASHGGKLWKAVAQSGPSANGAVEPGTDEGFWAPESVSVEGGDGGLGRTEDGELAVFVGDGLTLEETAWDDNQEPPPDPPHVPNKKVKVDPAKVVTLRNNDDPENPSASYYWAATAQDVYDFFDKYRGVSHVNLLVLGLTADIVTDRFLELSRFMGDGIAGGLKINLNGHTWTANSGINVGDVGVLQLANSVPASGELCFANGDSLLVSNVACFELGARIRGGGADSCALALHSATRAMFHHNSANTAWVADGTVHLSESSEAVFARSCTDAEVASYAWEGLYGMVRDGAPNALKDTYLRWAKASGVANNYNLARDAAGRLYVNVAAAALASIDDAAWTTADA